MNHPYTQPLITLFQQHANSSDAAAMAQYMRNQFAFFGIKAPQRKELLKQFWREQGPPPLAQANEIVRDLWARPERECQYSTLFLLEKMRKKLPESTIDLIEELIVTKSWWDTIDFLSSHEAGYYFRQFPATRSTHLARWRQSEDFWLRRSAILFQLKYKKGTDTELLFAILKENLGSDEFFINKAIGWALREYSKVNETAVTHFVQNTPLHPLSEREALKWLERQKSRS
jgi:3-methyladenine DNA glycosylase AlkD